MAVAEIMARLNASSFNSEYRLRHPMSQSLLASRFLVRLLCEQHPFSPSDFPKPPRPYQSFLDRFRDDGQQVINIGLPLVSQRLYVLLQRAIDFSGSFCHHLIPFTFFTGRVSDTVTLIEF